MLCTSTMSVFSASDYHKPDLVVPFTLNLIRSVLLLNSFFRCPRKCMLIVKLEQEISGGGLYETGWEGM